VGGPAAKALALVLAFGAVGFIAGFFLCELLFRWGGPFAANFGFVLGIPLSTTAGIMVGLYLARRPEPVRRILS
jgi:hypothetical protein